MTPTRPTLGDAEHEAWELHEWTQEGRRLLDGMLTSAAIPHSWQGSTLLAPEVSHERIADLVAEVGDGDARIGTDDDDDDPDDDADHDPDDAADDVFPAAIRDDEGEGEGDDEVAYDLTGWTDAQRGGLVAALAEAAIPHRWDADEDLVVAAEDEARTDEVFAQLEGGGAMTAVDDVDTWADDDADGGIDDGLLVQETLSDLFVGADRLVHNPLDGSASRQVIDGRDTARTLRLPFGFERTQWQSILTSVDALVDEISPEAPDEGAAPTPDDDAIREAAADLRRRLREVV